MNAQIFAAPRLADPPPKTTRWRARVAAVDFAFQPIVSIHTGHCLGYECLLRDTHLAGLNSIAEFLDAAYADLMLHEVEHWLREKALLKFKTIPHHRSTRLFVNVDSRYFEDLGRFADPTPELLAKMDLPATSLCVEISEHHPLLGRPEIQPVLAAFRKAGIRIALDDFGTGFSGLQALYYAEPDFIKIDRFFISDIATDSKKTLFVANIVNIAHLLGARVIAEGVETENEYFKCLGIGCDFVQGYFVQKPDQDVARMEARYPLIEEAAKRNRRRTDSDERLIYDQIEPLPTIEIQTDIFRVFDRFRLHKHCTFFPVVNASHEPQGIIKENALKDYVYSQYGRDLLRNRSVGHTIRDFVTRCPIADINTRAERILELFSMDNSSEGVAIVRGMRYLGFLSARSLLRIIHEKNISVARDQNPLTKLPGNFMIHEYLDEAVRNVDSAFVLAYFDFDHFKPFNDNYGFREGDRAIQLFAEALKRKLLDLRHFIGHVGGDDFFAGFKNTDFDVAREAAADLIGQFKRDVESLYRPQDRQTGFILATDREGNSHRYPLLTVSVALLHLPPGRSTMALDDISLWMADLKKTAKTSPAGLSAASLWKFDRGTAKCP